MILDPAVAKATTRRRFGTQEVRAPNEAEAARVLAGLVLAS